MKWMKTTATEMRKTQDRRDDFSKYKLKLEEFQGICNRFFL